MSTPFVTQQQRNTIIKAVIDGAESLAQLALWTQLPSESLAPIAEELDQIIAFYSRFERFARESMQDVEFPPPPNPYYDADRSIDAQVPVYYAYEAASRGKMTRERAIWVCEKLGLQEDEAATALDAVSMPWVAANNWMSYARAYYDEEGNETHLFLQSQTPMKLKPHIAHWLTGESVTAAG